QHDRQAERVGDDVPGVPGREEPQDAGEEPLLHGANLPARPAPRQWPVGTSPARATYRRHRTAGQRMSITPSWLLVLGDTGPTMIPPGVGSATTHQPLRQPFAPLPLTNGAPGSWSHCLRLAPLMYAQSNLKLANVGMWYQVFTPVPMSP